MKKLVVIIFLLTSVSAKAEVTASAVFEQMKQLIGVWEREKSKNSTFNISFELIANGTTLVETWLSKGKKHSLTLYHLDGKNLLATHYCPQGNQPRLKLKANSNLNDFSFEFLDATNLASLDHSHQHSLGFQLSQSLEKVVRTESYLSASGEKASKLNLVRKND